MMAGATTRPFDVADHLDNPKEVAAFQTTPNGCVRDQ